MSNESANIEKSTRHSAPEIDARPDTGYPTSHASVHDNPLAHKSVHELRELLDARKIDYKGLVDKVTFLNISYIKSY